MNTTKTDPKKKACLQKIANIHSMIIAKRNEDLFRFRTCCADPRASK